MCQVTHTGIYIHSPVEARTIKQVIIQTQPEQMGFNSSIPLATFSRPVVF